MSLFKLVVYGAVGYLVYQMFFAEMPSARGSGGPSRVGQGSPRSQQRNAGGEEQAIENSPAARQNMTGGGSGQPVQSLETDGGSVRHVVGRGVISR